MSASAVALAVTLGLAAGVLAGLFGVGGGILFVPTLVALGLGQVEAQATSLLAILPTVAAGAWNQRRYGNLRARTAVVVGLASILGVEAGRGSRRRCPRTRSGASSQCCSSPWRHSSPGGHTARPGATLERVDP